MSLFEERLAGLPLVVDDYDLHGHQLDVSSDFTRQSTVIALRGGGEEGRGEDVTYDPPDQEALQAAGAVQPLAGEWTLGSFCAHVEGLDLWPEPAAREASEQYRLWAYESAALDLALRQAGTSLAARLEREPRPVTFVVSMRLGEPSSLEPVARLLANYPDLRFKLDAVADWDDGLVAELVDSEAVDSLDLKGLYSGSPVDNAADPELYRRVAEAFPDAWIEDPLLNEETDPVLEPYRDRITWDAPIHSWADVEALPFMPRCLNCKPSRFGTLARLCEFYDRCGEAGIALYGGGQFELGVGRGQIQALASLFHADASNDVAPGGYNAREPRGGLETSPLEPSLAPFGFRRELS